METSNSPYEQSDIEHEGTAFEEEPPIDAEDIAEYSESDVKPADWLHTHQIRAPEDDAPRRPRRSGGVEDRAGSEVSLRAQQGVDAATTEPTAAEVVTLYRRIATIIGNARGQLYEDMRQFIVPARNYAFADSGRRRETVGGDGGGDGVDEHLRAAIEAYPRALAAVEHAEADAGCTQRGASSGAQIKPAASASGTSEAAPSDAAGLALQHLPSLQVQVLPGVLGDPTGRTSDEGEGQQHDVDPPAVSHVIAESDHTAPVTPHLGSNAHAGPPDIERLRLMVPRVKICVGDSTQARMGVNTEVVETYAEALRAGDRLPPPELVRDDANDCFWTADGHHRILARDRLHGADGGYELEAMVRPGTRRDAVLLAVAANGAHGLPRTNADKRRAVTLLLEDAEWREWSDREIARRCKVGHSLVAEVRHDLFGQVADAESRRFVTKHGTESKMRLRSRQRAADVAHHAGPEPARLEPAAGDVDTGGRESVPRALDERTDEGSPRNLGDVGKFSLAAAAGEPGGGRLAAANGGQLGVVVGGGPMTPALVPALFKPVVPAGAVMSAGFDVTSAPEAPTPLDEMRRVHLMFAAAMEELQGLGRQISSVAILTRMELFPRYEAAVSMGYKTLTRLWECEEVLAGRIPGKRAAQAGMGHPQAKSRPARTRSRPAAQNSAAQAIPPAAAKPGEAREPSLAKTSPKSRVESQYKQTKRVGKPRQ